MPKKSKKKNDIEDLEENTQHDMEEIEELEELENYDEVPPTPEEVDDSKEEDESTSSSIESEMKMMDDDDDVLNIAIEIEEDDLDLTLNNNDIKTEEVDSEESIDSLIDLSKHKAEGKHSLKYDSIFKGKKEDPIDEDNPEGFSSYRKDTIEVDKSSNYYFESMDNENYVRSKLVKEKVYDVLTTHTSINFLNNRRKPSKIDFNQYYTLLKSHLTNESFTNIEIFNELSVYFSDNIFNMFKLLENRWRNQIIKELQDHIGKNTNSKEITNRNIYEGTEIEFIHIDEFGDEKLITGVVIETDYQLSSFKVDSYENMYYINIDKINKILNNTKFKYNLNKLNNIDFI